MNAGFSRRNFDQKIRAIFQDQQMYLYKTKQILMLNFPKGRIIPQFIRPGHQKSVIPFLLEWIQFRDGHKIHSSGQMLVPSPLVL